MTIKVNGLPVAEGNEVELDRVLLVSDGKNTTIGNPLIQGAKVTASAVESGKDKKVMVFKYKNKVRYRRLTGHRQPYTLLNIKEILLPQAKEEGGA